MAIISTTSKILNFKIRLIKSIIKMVLVLIFLLALAVGAFLLLFDFSQWNDLIAKETQKILGRSLVVKGRVRPTIDPRNPGFVFHNVILKAANPNQTEISARAIVVGTKDIVKIIKTKSLGQDVGLNIEIVGLEFAEQKIQFAKFTFKLNDGNIILKPLSIRAFKANFYGEVRYSKNKKLNIAGKISKFDWGQFLKDAKGNFDANISLKSKGITPDQLLNNLTGKILITADKGQIAGKIIDLWASDLLTTIVPIPGKSKYTNIICGVGLFNIKNGVADSKIIIDTDNVLIKGKGDIIIPKSELDLKLIPKPKNPSLFSMATPVNIRGDWSDPTITPSAGGVLKKLGGIFLSTVNPAALALPFLKLGTGNDNPCLKMLTNNAKGK